MTRYNGIDFFRFIGVASVLMLHTDFGPLSSSFVVDLRLISRWAVPFYFITAGFFLAENFEYSKVNHAKNLDRLMRMTTIFFISSLIYFPISILQEKYLFQISTLLMGTSFHLWFIGALIWSTFFIWYFHFIGKKKLLLLISCILLISAVFTNSYDLLFSFDIDYSFFMFLSSVPFVYLGFIFKEKKIKLRSPSIYLFMICIGLITQKIEAKYFENIFGKSQFEQQLLIGTIIIAISIFFLSLALNFKENRISYLGKKYSLFIYLLHPLVYLIMDYFYALGQNDLLIYLRLFNPLICLSLTLFLSISINNVAPTLFRFINGDFNVIVSKDTQEK